MNLNPMPKAAFLASKKLAEDHNRLLDNPAFQLAIASAREQYVRRICELAPTSLDSPHQLQASAMCFQRIKGANDFIDTLLKLAQPPQKVERTTSPNLNHGA